MTLMSKRNIMTSLGLVLSCILTCYIKVHLAMMRSCESGSEKKMITLFNSMDSFNSGIKDYGLFTNKSSLDYKKALIKAQERDRDFLTSYVESKIILWQFEFETIKYTMTCSMDTILMNLFLYVIKNVSLKRHSQWALPQ